MIDSEVVVRLPETREFHWSKIERQIQREAMTPQRPAVSWLGQFRRFLLPIAGVTALDSVSFSISGGECHALMGENGAGKSTLGKILAGIHRADGGQVLIDGRPQVFRSPADAMAAGSMPVRTRIDEEYRGRAGPLKVTESNENGAIYDALIKAAGVKLE